ncbi:MAG TPA: YkvA family protein [Xanthobacteraceae bacterium]|nr:YkvA family protein [Xanthobacteraceae bacterium]
MWSWNQAATSENFSWADFAALTRRLTADDAGLRRKFWRRLKREAASIPFLEELLTAHYCAFDRNTPLYVKVVLAGAIVYFVVPDDFIPASLPLLAYADDAAVLAAAFKVVSSHIKPEHREAARRMVRRLRAEAA